MGVDARGSPRIVFRHGVLGDTRGYEWGSGGWCDRGAFLSWSEVVECG